ncbi:S9 family peptidase, partial [Flavobacteriaceae bacterium]|nr:S9 family peptidase [Flavobacteriaceae bacterium]
MPLNTKKEIITLLSIFLSYSSLYSQNETTRQTPKANYRQAAKYSPKKLGKLVHSTSVRPHWLKNGNRFWYQYKTTDGSNYYLVDADKGIRTKLFDNAKMAQWLTEITKDPYDAQHLPRFNFKFVKNESAIRFRVTATEEVLSKEEEKITSKTDTTLSKQ